MGLLQNVYQKIESEGLLDEITHLYNQHGGRRLVSERLNISYNSVGHVIDHFGINITRHDRRKLEKYKGKIRNPFDGSDFGDYLIGYVIGDGSIIVRKGSVRGFTISSSDYEHLLRIRDLWDPSLKVYGPNKGNYTISCYDSEIANYLISVGIVPSKSKVGMHLSIPITGAMLRGLFDSDGSVSFVNNGTGLRVMFAGGRDYLKQFEDFIGDFPRYYVDRKTFICVYYGAYESVIRIRTLMYDNATIYLKRKHERFYKPNKYRLN